MHSSNICSVYVPKENKINQGITEKLYVQTTINNDAKSQRFLKTIRQSTAPIYVLFMCQGKTKFIEG